MARILIIDDDSIVCDSMAQRITKMGHSVSYVHTLSKGLQEIFSEQYDIVLLDVQLPDGNGLQAIPKIRERQSAPEVIIITGHGDPNGGKLAIEWGAWDYIEKPPTKEKITLPIMRAVEYRQKKSKHAKTMLLRDGIIGSSPQLNASLETLANVAFSDANVLITGETGTGKELFAHAVHQNSSRSSGNYIVVDCASLPETLAESILFGHEKGAFSGADKSKAGLVLDADGGSLFLDEIGELSLSLQSSFLRVLQERQFRPLGARKELQSDFRLIAATNRNLDNMVREGTFRSDLLYRLRSLTLTIPTLRERKSDIFEITWHYIRSYCARNNLEAKGLSPDFIYAITTYTWPGNVRELVNTLDHVLAESKLEPILYVHHLPIPIRAQVTKLTVTGPHQSNTSESPPFLNAPNGSVIQHFKDVKEHVEKEYIRKLMSITGGNKKEAAALSGLSRQHIYHLLQKYGM